jgi:peptidyl-tRNA hydrolase, PTH1 family
MLIIFGLGNNEERYLNTKHNIGRKILEHWANMYEHTGFKRKNGFFAARVDSLEEPVYFVYPTGYMNVSGEALSDFARFFKIDKSKARLLILQDDSDQKEGNWKLVQGGRSAGHRGIDSIHKHILGIDVDPDNIWRLKIGIRPDQNTSKSMTFVLSRLSKIDDLSVTKLTELCLKQTTSILKNEWSKAQNFINTEKIV